MKKLLVMLVGGAMMLSCASLSAAEFFISQAGRDSNPGSRAKPFATLEAARDAIRAMDKQARGKGVTVWIWSGSYTLSDTFELDARDSGSEGAPIVYAAEKDAQVTLLGGILIAPEAFTPVKDQAIIERLDESARGKVLQFALSKQGATEAGETGLPVQNELVNGIMFSIRLPVPELFFNGEELPFSKWPNTGWAKYGKVIEAGSVPRFGDQSNRPGTLEYTDTRPERWTKAEHIFIHGYFAEDWFDDVLKVGNLDIQQRRITFTTPHMYGLKPNMRYRALGLLEEIDQPGEWMVDHKAGILYLYPPTDMGKGQLALSMLKTPMIRMKQTQHVTFRDLNLEVTQGTCVDIAGGTDNLIAGCTIRNVGGCGILIRPMDHEVKDPGGLHQFRKESGDPLKDGRRNGVVGCTLNNIGTTGISMLGGDRETLAPSRHYAVNNDIHHYARRQRANQPAINMNGVGQRAAHNYIHDAPHVGLDYSGNDHLVEYNELTRLCQETGDVGAIYSGRNWTYRGNVVRYNYIHHIQGPGKHGSMAVYLDDSCSSTHIYGNLFNKVQRAAFIGGGRDNTVENNIFVDVSLAVHLDNRSEGWANKYQKPGGDHRMYEKLKDVNHDKPPYSTRYPELARILDETPHKPLGNKVLNNICVRSKWVGGGAEGSLQMKQNLVTDSDPGFRDLEASDFSFKALAEIQKQLPEFKPIPFEKIGLQKDEYRERGADDGPDLPPDALAKSTSKTLPPEYPDDHLPAVAGSVAVDWTKSIRDLPGEAWGINDYEILDPKLAADAGYNKFLQKARPAWVRIHNAGLPKTWLDASGKAWDVAKIKACFAGANGLADTKLMMNVSRWPDWMKDEQGLLRKDYYQAYADLYVGLMRILRDEVKRKIEYWEIMNETDGPYDKAKRLDDLWEVYNTVAVAMKKFDPQAKVGGIAFTWANQNWVDGFAKNCLANADFVTYHNYGTGDMYDSNETLFGKLSSMEGSARSVRKIVDRYAAGRHVPVFLDEYNVKWVWTPIERRHGNSVGSVFHAGVVRRAMLAGVDGTAIWHLKGSAYGLIEADNGIRPASQLFVWAPQLLVGKMMDVKASDSLEVLAVIRADGGRSVLIANKANHTVELGSVDALGLGGTGPVEMRQVNSRSVVDGVAAPQSLSLPGYSVTILSTAR